MQEGGKREWDRIKELAVKPKNPAQGMAAMLALGATQDLALAEKTFQFMVNEAQDQDVLFVARGLQTNYKTRKFLARRTKEEFATLEKKYSGTFTMARWIEVCMLGSLALEAWDSEEMLMAPGRDRSNNCLPPRTMRRRRRSSRIGTRRNTTWRSSRRWITFRHVQHGSRYVSI